MPPDPASNKTVVKEVALKGHFRVEMGDSRNRNFLWPADQRKLRGRWSRANLPGVTTDDRFTDMPDLPGLLIDIDLDNRVLRFLDPLAHPANKALLLKAQRASKLAFNVEMTPEFMPTGVLTFKDLTPNELKSACFYVRRFLDAAQCTSVRGRVPSVEEIMGLAGRIAFEVYDSSPTVDHHREPVRYIAVKPEEGKVEEASVVEMFDERG